MSLTKHCLYGSFGSHCDQEKICFQSINRTRTMGDNSWSKLDSEWDWYRLKMQNKHGLFSNCSKNVRFILSEMQNKHGILSNCS